MFYNKTQNRNVSAETDLTNKDSRMHVKSTTIFLQNLWAKNQKAR